MFSALSEYRKKFGDCNVPIRWSENTQLARWVANLRGRRGKLTDDQANRLGEIGFIWNPFEVAWDEMFKALQEYRQINGHCNVPAKYPDNQKFASWVTGQRAKQSKLTKERFDRLDSIGFQWKMKTGPKPRRIQ